jgi:hypothetical protein
LVFKKNANFFAENWEKSQKIVIITSTPGHTATKAHRQKIAEAMDEEGVGAFSTV